MKKTLLILSLVASLCAKAQVQKVNFYGGIPPTGGKYAWNVYKIKDTVVLAFSAKYKNYSTNVRQINIVTPPEFIKLTGDSSCIVVIPINVSFKEFSFVVAKPVKK